MFQISNISKSYGKKNILNNISLTAMPKEAIGILGVNGSGKSTLLSCIAKSSSNNSDFKIGYVPQENPLFDELKPVDNIKMWCSKSKKEILEALSSQPLCYLGITDYLDTPVSKMSGGMKKKLSIACTLINKPGVLLMDEPFAALDLTTKHDILSYMTNYLEQGNIIIIASHDEEIFNFCSRVFLLKNGQLTDTSILKEKNISYIDMLRD